ncbi:hypothetical protein BDA96_05G189700 [Sorghum bicolor]|uniref:Uncharacterized protein n=1 Tax=Sorghum bicolor TaxID=4558 RepID=A0A921QY32_SORBI|nr:hypothetical protein BDA96_05G189700 [Sorghum bicolor]
MRTQCTALCIVLMIMSSNLSSCYRVIVVNYHLYGCTEARCQTKCLQYANKYNQAVKSFQCVKADLCH